MDVVVVVIVIEIDKLTVYKASRNEKEITMSNRQTKAFVAPISKVIKNMR